MTEPSQIHHITELTPRQALARQATGAELLDVRELAEHWQGMPHKARSLPCSVLAERAGIELPDRERDILLLCGTGRRSLWAAQTLHTLGYVRTASVAGGFQRWQREGLPLANDDNLHGYGERYARQMCLPQIGIAGQTRLGESAVALVGVGGLGSPVALYLAAAGVGRITLIDGDRVERSNLHRQIAHTDERVGMAKVESARLALEALNPGIDIRSHRGRLNADNARAWLHGHDVVVDGADNFPTRYVLAEACHALGVPLVYAAIERFHGQASVFDPRRSDSPCYRCLFPDAPEAADVPNCAEAGVLGVLPGLLGTLQANETLKLLLGIGESLVGRLLDIDALTMRFRERRLARNPHCPGCGPHARTAFVTGDRCDDYPRHPREPSMP